MKNIPKHFRLVKEGPDHYEIHDARDKKHFKVAKKDLDLSMHGKLSKIQKFAGGGDVAADDSSSSGAPQPQETPTAPPVTVNVTQAPTEPVPTPAAVGARLMDSLTHAPPLPAAPVPPVAAEPIRAPAAAAAPATPAAVPSLVGQAQAAQGLSEKGIREQNAADAQNQAANAGVLKQNNDRMQVLMDGYKKSRETLDLEHKNLTQAVMDQKIDPDRYWHDKSLPGKVSTALGVILGGLGAGLQHSTVNQALQVVQNGIKEDIEAQKAELGKKTTLLSINMEKYKNLDAATAATMAQMNAMVEGQLKLNAAKSGSLRANGAADYAIGVNRASYIGQLPALAMADFKAGMMREEGGGGQPAPSGGSHILNPGGTTGSPAVTGTKGGKPAEMEEDSGPTHFDAIREAEIAKGRDIPRDPSRNGLGVDLNRMHRLKLSGIMDKDEGKKATEEYGHYTKLQHELIEANKVFDIASRNATFRGRISRGLKPHEIEGGGSIVGDIVKPVAHGLKSLVALGDEATKQYTAVVEPFVDKLAKDVTGRSTPISIEKLGTLMPEEGDSPLTLATKRQKMLDTIKGSYAFPTLVEHKLVHGHDPLVNVGSRKGS